MKDETKLIIVIVLVGVLAAAIVIFVPDGRVKIEGNVKITSQTPTPAPSPTEVWCGKPVASPSQK